MLNGVLWSIPNTKRIHLFCKIPTRDLCEPRKTSERKLSYRFWKESWYIYFSGLKQSPSVSFSAVQSLPSSAGLAGLADGVGKKGERGQAHPSALQDGFQVLLLLAREQMSPNERWGEIRLIAILRELLGSTGLKCAAAEDQSVPKRAIVLRGLCAHGRKAGQEKFSCEETKHPALLYTPLLSFSAKQDLIIITRTEKETLVVYNDVFRCERFLYCSVFQNTNVLVICSF